MQCGQLIIFVHILYIRYVVGVGYGGRVCWNHPVLVSLFRYCRKNPLKWIFQSFVHSKNVLACHLSFSAMSTSSFSRPSSHAWFPFEDIYPVRISISVDIIIGNKHKLLHCLASFSHDTLSRLSCRCTRLNKTAIIKRVSQPSFFLSLRLYGKQQQTLKQL